MRSSGSAKGHLHVCCMCVMMHTRYDEQCALPQIKLKALKAAAPGAVVEVAVEAPSVEAPAVEAPSVNDPDVVHVSVEERLDVAPGAEAPSGPSGPPGVAELLRAKNVSDARTEEARVCLLYTSPSPRDRG